MPIEQQYLEKNTELILMCINKTVKNLRSYSTAADEVWGSALLEKCKLPSTQKDKKFRKWTVERLRGLFT